MRISDWSSDVCSSDLSVQGSRCDRRAVAARCLLRAADGCERARCALCRLAGCGIAGAQRPLTLQQRRSEHIDADAGDAERREAVDPVEQTWVEPAAQFADAHTEPAPPTGHAIGSASWRVRVCAYAELSVAHES